MCSSAVRFATMREVKTGNSPSFVVVKFAVLDAGLVPLGGALHGGGGDVLWRRGRHWGGRNAPSASPRKTNAIKTFITFKNMWDILGFTFFLTAEQHVKMNNCHLPLKLCRSGKPVFHQMWLQQVNAGVPGRFGDFSCKRAGRKRFTISQKDHSAETWWQKCRSTHFIKCS